MSKCPMSSKDKPELKYNFTARDGNLTAVMNTVLDGLIIIDSVGTIQTFNPSAVKVFGYEADEVIGQNVKMLMPDPYHSEHDSYLNNYKKTKKAKVIGIGREVIGKRKNGDTFPMELGVNEMHLGEELMYVGTVRDISERKAHEVESAKYIASLKTNNDNLNAVMNTVLDGLIIIDSVGTIQSFNPSAVRVFGYEADEVIGQNVKMLMPDPYHSEHDGYLNNYKKTKKAKVIGIGREVIGKRKNGDTFPMELGVNEMRLGDELMYVGTVRDISERKSHEREIKNYIHSLKVSNQELDDFAYIASHDLKEPIRGLSNNANFLKEDYENVLEKDAINRLDRIVFLCERMESLVNDLLYFSRLGKKDLAIKKVNLDEIIDGIKQMMDSVIQESSTKITIKGKLPNITCDSVNITEVFRNLISNAIKYNDKMEKIIEIGYVENPPQQEAGKHVFYVRDNGKGIPEHYYQEIFRIFKRLNDEDDKVKGTGVGLTFVKKIIERHGGSIWLDSEIKKGTTFYFSIMKGFESEQTFDIAN